MMSRRVLGWLVIRGAAISLIGGLVAGSVILCNATLHVAKPAETISPTPFPRGGAPWSNVTVRAHDGVILAAWFSAQPKQQDNCVVILHGIGDSKSGSAGFASLFTDAGYSILMPDSRAHGSSGGELVTYGLQEKLDVLDWLRFLHLRGCRTVFGMSESMGAAVLIQAAALTSDISAIVAESSYSTLMSIADYRVGRTLGLPHWLHNPISEIFVRGASAFARLRYGIDLASASPLAGMAETRTPILLIHGTDDTETPPWHSRRLAAANSSASLWLVPGAPHCGAYATSPAEFRERVLEWFARFQR